MNSAPHVVKPLTCEKANLVVKYAQYGHVLLPQALLSSYGYLLTHNVLEKSFRSRRPSSVLSLIPHTRPGTMPCHFIATCHSIIRVRRNLPRHGEAAVHRMAREDLEVSEDLGGVRTSSSREDLSVSTCTTLAEVPERRFIAS